MIDDLLHIGQDHFSCGVYGNELTTLLPPVIVEADAVNLVTEDLNKAVDDENIEIGKTVEKPLQYFKNCRRAGDTAGDAVLSPEKARDLHRPSVLKYCKFCAKIKKQGEIFPFPCLMRFFMKIEKFFPPKRNSTDERNCVLFFYTLCHIFKLIAIISCAFLICKKFYTCRKFYSFVGFSCESCNSYTPHPFSANGLPIVFLMLLFIWAFVKVMKDPQKYDIHSEDYYANGKPIPSQRLPYEGMDPDHPTLWEKIKRKRTAQR